MNRVATGSGKERMSAPLRLDQSKLQAARHDLNEGAVTPGAGAWREEIVALLGGALATELVCMLRYRRHYFMANGLASPHVAEEFLAHANEELGHADRIAERIAQLGGEPDFRPDSLAARSLADYDDAADLTAMIKADLAAERVAIEAYRQMIALVADKDPTTRTLLEGILANEEEHAEDLRVLIA
ncbi:MAG: ferritin-like domain-containing protein [Burkholderiales bacterium]|nr:ferritin-like domain-containing protein [Burkholderiales bacterium]